MIKYEYNRIEIIVDELTLGNDIVIGDTVVYNRIANLAPGPIIIKDKANFAVIGTIAANEWYGWKYKGKASGYNGGDELNVNIEIRDDEGVCKLNVSGQ